MSGNDGDLGSIANGLGKYCQREGLQRASAPVSQIPEYIVRCQHKAKILSHKADIMERLKVLKPKKYREFERVGFETLIVELSDIKYKRFLQVLASHDIVEAYLTICLHGYHYTPPLPAGSGVPNP